MLVCSRVWSSEAQIDGIDVHYLCRRIDADAAHSYSDGHTASFSYCLLKLGVLAIVSLEREREGAKTKAFMELVPIVLWYLSSSLSL
jgi:hypothetical protein